jgi:hypothetical protein
VSEIEGNAHAALTARETLPAPARAAFVIMESAADEEAIRSHRDHPGAELILLP